MELADAVRSIYTGNDFQLDDQPDRPCFVRDDEHDQLEWLVRDPGVSPPRAYYCPNNAQEQAFREFMGKFLAELERSTLVSLTPTEFSEWRELFSGYVERRIGAAADAEPWALPRTGEVVPPSQTLTQADEAAVAFLDSLEVRHAGDDEEIVVYSRASAQRVRQAVQAQTASEHPCTAESLSPSTIVLYKYDYSDNRMFAALARVQEASEAAVTVLWLRPASGRPPSCVWGEATHGRAPVIQVIQYQAIMAWNLSLNEGKWLVTLICIVSSHN